MIAMGDTWDHVATDAESRLVIGVMPGERTAANVVEVVADFKRRNGSRLMDLITTDGYPAYAAGLADHVWSIPEWLASPSVRRS